tara:strand:- start:907 stop:1914 length:1008 start_codon:yes stop_codon:yes gene_type:complete
MLLNTKTEIFKYSLKEPNADIMIFKNSIINNNVITINTELKLEEYFLPTMYQSWTSRQSSYINFNIEQNYNIDIQNNDILYIFDTWGISSYYHLLIDHIIPLWITKNCIENYFAKKEESLGKPFYYRISNNNYNRELSTTKDIFKYFFNDIYSDTITGNFKYIVYGYCYTYRPYHGPNYIYKYYPNYQTIFDKFICKYKHETNLSEKDKYILIPERSTRNYDGIEDIYISLSKIYNVKKIDFGKYSIDEQIKICASSWAIIGCEGAAFANQIFMNKGSLLIVLCHEKDIDHIPFQSSIAKYMDHKFFPIIINNIFNKNHILENILNITNNFYNIK